jgi:hypothetical protein
MPDKLPSQKIQDNLKLIIEQFSKEDETVRQRQIHTWKKMELYWSGYTNVYWDNTARDYRTWNADLNTGTSLNEASYYDKPVNVFKAYLETVIAALSTVVPKIKCAPDDAENPDDLTTAKGATKIAELVYQHIDAPLLWVKALYIYCTQGMIAAYNYPHCDEKYGLVEQPKYESKEEEVQKAYCSNCGVALPQQDKIAADDLNEQEETEFAPDDEDAPLHAALDDAEKTGGVICPSCMVQMDPDFKTEKVIVQRLTGFTQNPKSRQLIDVNGGLFVRVPNYARKQEDIPYLAYCYETHYVNVFKKYPDLRSKFTGGKIGTYSTGNADYERWGRLSTQYLGEFPTDTPTVRNWWLRPQAFEIINDDAERKELYKRYPDGCKVVLVNEEFAEACNENLDDCWTLTYNPLSESIHFDPLGLMLTSVQEITNDLIALTLQTIEQGIPQTFVDPQTLNLDLYSKSEVRPGSIYPAKPKTGKSLQDSFFMTKTASLGPEVMPFGEKIEQLGQFTSGAMPGLFGGGGPASQRTSGQAQLARNAAMQRLQTPWKMLNYWWKNVFSKVIPAYIEDMLEDERIVREVHNNYINDVIERAQLGGKIGNISVESSDSLPQTWAETRDVLMNLIQLNNPQVLEILGGPENLELISDALGVTDFVMPGEADREKQFREIQILLGAAPIQDANGQEIPSLMPELMVDDHKVEADITRYWLVSEAGQIAKLKNEEGYKNVVAHLKAHINMMKQLQGPPMPPGGNKKPGPLVQPKPAGPQNNPNVGQSVNPRDNGQPING